VLLYVAAFACSFGPVVWVVISEIFPTRIRGRAMSLATLTLWVACYLVSQTFPMLVERIGAGNSFLVYAAMSLMSLVFIVWLLPETKGRTLEEIQHDWQTSADAVPQPMALPQPHEL
jgi:SP family arabinose:H+ symporter-like MFS transporter